MTQMTFRQFETFVDDAHHRYTGNFETYRETCMRALTEFVPKLAKQLEESPYYSACGDMLFSWLQEHWDT